MGCQRAIAEQIVAAGADYVLAVKDNQPELHEAIEDYFHTARASDFAGVSVDIDEQVDSGHGRIEVRRCYDHGRRRPNYTHVHRLSTKGNYRWHDSC